MDTVMTKRPKKLAAPEAITLPSQCCATCKHYIMGPRLCRRYPPAVVLAKPSAQGISYHTAFPVMNPDGVCGEWGGWAVTPEIIRARIAEIAKIAPFDDEAAHSMEDDLFQDVLRAIAGGNANPAELANLALTSCNIHFNRWCA